MDQRGRLERLHAAKDFLPREAVMPAPSAATAGSAPSLHLIPAFSAASGSIFLSAPASAFVAPGLPRIFWDFSQTRRRSGTEPFAAGPIFPSTSAAAPAM